MWTDDSSLPANRRLRIEREREREEGDRENRSRAKRRDPLSLHKTYHRMTRDRRTKSKNFLPKNRLLHLTGLYI